jgi:tetratricopeptide (TPR) repeat protein
MEGPEATAWRARIRSNLGGVRNRQGRWAEAISACREAIAEAESVGELPALAHACYGLDWALIESGHPEEATHSDRALEIYERLGDLEREAAVLNNLGMFAYFEGRWDAAIDLYRRSGECSERAGTPSDVARTECNVGEILSDQGRFEDAEEHLQRARRVWSGTQERQAVAFVDVLLGRLAVRRGDCEEGLSMLEAATSDLRRFRMDAYADFAQVLIAEAEAFAGDPQRGLGIAGQELEATDRHRQWLERVTGIALARLGRIAAAQDALTCALATARERRAAYDIAATIDVLAALGLADADVLRERDGIMAQLKIERMPGPVLALGAT